MTEQNSRQLDEELAELLKELQTFGAPELQTLDPADARAAYAKGVSLLAGTPPDIAGSDTIQFESGVGPVDVRVYYPESNRERPLPLVLYFHGGGWSFGSIETHDTVCRTLCARARCIVASVDYHLAPEHKFPRAVHDAIEACSWASEYARALGAAPNKLVLAGDSAGGNLAAVAALAARDTGWPRIACQLLIYPATDLSMSHASHREMGDGYRLTRPLMIWSSTNYLRDGRDIMNPKASPLFAKDHRGLPPTILVTAGFDPLRDEGAAYAAMLRDAAVAVDYKCFDSLTHGFINLTGAVAEAARALDEIALMLKRHL